MSETTTHGISCACGETFQTPAKLEDHVMTHRLQSEPQDRNTRQPTDEELNDLIQWYQNTHNVSPQEAVDTINQCYYVVIEDYQTGCPGYADRILIEIGSASPSHHRVYTWHDDMLRQAKPAEAIQRQGGY